MKAKRILWVLALAAALLAGFAFYRSRTSGPRLSVEPHAAEEIEKAKRR